MTSPLDHIPAISQWFAAANLHELELSGPGGHLRLHRGGTGPAPDHDGAPASMAQAAGQRRVVASPGAGVFLHAHPLRDEPLVRPGVRVAEAQPLGLLQIGALLVPVVAPGPGVVASVPGADGALVGFGDVLFELAQPG